MEKITRPRYKRNRHTGNPKRWPGGSDSELWLLYGRRALLRKNFWQDHFDELSAIVRGENDRPIDAPVRPWKKKVVA